MPAENKERECWLGFNCFQKIGPATFSRLANFFPNIQQAFFSNEKSLRRAGLKDKIISEFLSWRKDWRAEKVLATLRLKKIDFLIKTDSVYPLLLKEIHAAPPLLYYRGQKPGADKKIFLAVVGARHHSTYATKLINNLLPPLIQKEVIIISGLAVGVDSLAHRQALENQGITWAVLACGLDKIYPWENISLAQEIIRSGGTIWSEFPLNTPPLKNHFPRRNRIIAGMSQGTLVVEGDEKSGALITAYQALEQNREVMSVPGNVFSQFSLGTNKLIKEGARAITNAQDIFECFGLVSEQEKNKNSPRKLQSENYQIFNHADEYEKIIYQCLIAAHERAEKLNSDQLAQISGLDIALINSKLSLMEINGIAQNDGFGYYLNESK